MDDGSRPLDRHDALIQKAADAVQQTRDIIATSQQELDSMKETISYTDETVVRIRKLLEDQQIPNA